MFGRILLYFLFALYFANSLAAIPILVSFNASDYSPIRGSLLSGTISDTNVTDSVSLRFLEGLYNPNATACFQLSASATIPQCQNWMTTGWSATAAASTPATAGNTQWIQLVASPTKNEKIMVTLDSNSDIDAQIWNGVSWSATTEFTPSASTAALRSFDVAYEQLSGRALAVFANATTQALTYRVWDGSSWGPNKGLVIGTAAAINQIVALKPRPNSNQIMLMVSATAATPDLYAILWNGTNEFNTTTSVAITAELDTTSDQESFDGRWESSSGDFNAYYGQDASVTIFRQTFSNGVWEAPVAGNNSVDGDIRFVRAAAFPDTDRQMVCWLEWTAGDINCQSFDGTNFQGTKSNLSVEVGAVGRNFDVEPLLGSTNGFIVMYDFLNSDWFDFSMCTSAANCDGGIWQNRGLWSTTQLGGVDTRWGQIYADPYNPGNFTLLGTSQTAANGWYRARIYCNANYCNQSEAWTNFGGTTSVVFEGAAFTFDKNPFYRNEIYHNSTITSTAVPAAKAINFLNVTAKINSSLATTYALSIYDWVNSNWNYCTEAVMAPNVFSSLACNVTATPANYRSQDANRYIRIAVNSSVNKTTRAILEEDFLQFYLGISDDFPYYDFAASNLGVSNSTPMPGQNITFYSLWYDDVSLNRYWLEDNSTGAFAKEASLGFLQVNNSWGNYSFVIPGVAEGKQFMAKIWANDTQNQLNYTTNFTITVGMVAPSVGNTSINATLIYAWDAFCVNVSATDVGIGINQTWVLITYPNSSVSNFTLSDTGCNAGIAGDGRYGGLVNASGIIGNLTINTSFANDSLNNLNMQSPFPQLVVFVKYPENPIGGSNFYVGFYGNATGGVINSSEGSVKIYQSKLSEGSLFLARSGSSISWGKLKVADNGTDMPNMDVALNLTLAIDKLETYFTSYLDSIKNSTNGLASFQLSASATTPQYQNWTQNGWTATDAASTPATAGNTQWIKTIASPVRDEKIMVTLDSNSDIDAQTFKGGVWSATTEFTPSASTAALRSFDVAYEQLSGRALGVFANATTQALTFRVWNGTEWGPNRGISIGTAAAINQIVALKPRPKSNDIMLLVSATAATPDLYAMLWNGTDFNTTTNLAVTQELDTTSDQESFDGAWEETSGDFNVYYGEDTQVTIFRRSFSNGVWGAAVAGNNSVEGDIRFVRAANYPNTNRQMVCWLEFTAGDLNCQSFDGANFQGAWSNLTVEVGVVGRNFDVQPLLSSANGFLVMYGFLNADWFTFMKCASAANCDGGLWLNNGLWSSTQLGGFDTAWGQMYADKSNPGNFTLLGTSQTAADGWYRAKIFCNATLCEQNDPWTNFGATTSVAFESASFAFDAHLNYTDSTGSPCGLNETYYMATSDGNFKVGVIYSDEDSSNTYSAGDNIIFCTDFNINKPNAFGGTSDFEMSFPKSFANNVDMYFDA
ncbi:hypothetical protein HY989_02400 [Candidatus Micrarchaeota archaeon]|nr:hypothetical protein [Candidatus Micrarchaeota archaeon]